MLSSVYPSMMPSGYLESVYQQLTLGLPPPLLFKHITLQGQSCQGEIFQIKWRDKLKGCSVGDMHEAKMLRRKMLRHHLDHLSSMSDDQVYMSDH